MFVDADEVDTDDEAEASRNPAAALPTLQVNRTFLEDNAQSHTSAMSAFGDVFDNAKESKATTLRVYTETRPSRRGRERCLILADDGHGMSEKLVREGLMSIGYTRKTDLSSGCHYGFGAKTALPRLADYALIFTRDASGQRTIGLLSSSFSKSIDADQLRLPLCTWEADRDEVLSGVSESAPLKTRQRVASLRLLLDECEGLPYEDEGALLAEFSSPRGWSRTGTGTRIVLWQVIQDLNTRLSTDILIKSSKAVMKHQRSLRAYAEVLYLEQSAQGIVPTMQIFIGPKKVEYRDWSTYLDEDMRQEMMLPKPGAAEVQRQFEDADKQGRPSGRASVECGRSAVATMAIGYARGFDEVVRTLSHSSGQADSSEAKKEVEHEETGFFIYHKGRMTQFFKLKQQEKEKNLAKTAVYRILTLAMGVTGIIQENYLVQHHTKTEYKPSVGTTVLLQMLREDANKKLVSFIKPRVVKRYLDLTGKDFQSIRASACLGFSQGLRAQLAALGALGAGSNAAPSGASSNAGPSSPAAKHRRLELDVRMRPRDRNDAVVGRVELVPGTGQKQSLPLYKLRLEADNSLSTKTYKARELEPTSFDATRDLPPMLMAAPLTLVGCGAQIKWLVDDQGSMSWYDALLEPPAGAVATAAAVTDIDDDSCTGDGWFRLRYLHESYEEPIFIGIKPLIAIDCH